VFSHICTQIHEIKQPSDILTGKDVISHRSIHFSLYNRIYDKNDPCKITFSRNVTPESDPSEEKHNKRTAAKNTIVPLNVLTKKQLVTYH
jgi:hypothetical protein